MLGHGFPRTLDKLEENRDKSQLANWLLWHHLVLLATGSTIRVVALTIMSKYGPISLPTADGQTLILHFLQSSICPSATISRLYEVPWYVIEHLRRGPMLKGGNFLARPVRCADAGLGGKKLQD